MSPYLLHLLSDLQSAILARWRECPPHYYEMGVPERWLDPPQGYDGPPRGFGHDDDGPPPGLSWLDDDAETASPAPPPTESEQVMANLDFERSIAEMEQWRDETPPERQDMFYHFGFEPEQFPPAERLSDEELEALTHALCRLWAAYNFTPVFPDAAPGRAVYPLLLKRMEEPTFVMQRGHIGVEFCHYEPSECPWGLEYCDCKDF
jgi:hypothetical protein